MYLELAVAQFSSFRFCGWRHVFT